MTIVDEGASNPAGEALFRELLWVHGIIRNNLEIIEQLSDQVSNGAPVAQVRAQLDELAATSVVWRLRVSCLQYCTLVHHHHQLEDVAFFPGLRRANPALCPVIDKLEADHVTVARYLDEVEAAAARLGPDEAARTELTAALRGLAGHLLTHLDYEETNLAPTLRRLTGWP
jgi:hemerythrin-like domain-containing protein